MTKSGWDDWSAEYDAVICWMRGEGAPFAAIALATRKEEEEVKKRYYRLKQLTKRAGLSVKALAEAYKQDLVRGGHMEIKNGKYKLINPHLKDVKGKAKAKAVDTGSDSDSDSDSSSDSSSSSDDSDMSSVDSSSSDDSDSDSDSDSSSSSSSSSSSEEESYEEQLRRAVQESIAERVSLLATSYPDYKKTIKPTEHFSQLEVNAIAVFEARYRIDKWLYIACDWSNLTGRRMEPEIIKYIFEKDDKAPKRSKHSKH